MVHARHPGPSLGSESEISEDILWLIIVSKYKENGAKWLKVVYILPQSEKLNCFSS